MSNQINDGGPAFPHKPRVWNEEAECFGDDIFSCGHGMTIRDYFAAKAMQGCVSSYPNGLSGDPEDIATDSYSIADAMIEARKGGSK